MSGLKLLRVKITLGFGHGEYPVYYKKGEGRDLGGAIQDLLENSHASVTQEEFALMIGIADSMDKVDVTKQRNFRAPKPVKEDK